MRLSLGILALIPIFSHAALVEGPSLVKLSDGRAAYCAEPRDAGRAAYRPLSADVSPADQDALRFVVRTAFLLCEREGEVYSWKARNPQESLAGHDRDGTSIRTEISQPEFVLMSDTVPAVAKLQPVGTESEQEATFTIGVRELLSPAQWQALSRGERVNATVVFFERSILKVVYQDGHEVPIGLRAGGAYTVLFSLEKTEGNLVVRSLRFAR